MKHFVLLVRKSGIMLLDVVFIWLDDFFEKLEKKYPKEQSYKVTPEYISDLFQNYRAEVLPSNKNGN